LDFGAVPTLRPGGGGMGGGVVHFKITSISHPGV